MGRESTVHVDADQYAEHIPDDYNQETIPITVSAFSDTVYLKFPEWRDGGSVRDDGLPENARDEIRTTDFCAKVEPAVRALVEYTPNSRFGPDVQPITREVSKMYGSDSRSIVTTRHNVDEPEPIGSWNLDSMHKNVYLAFKNAILPDIESDYWQGYKDGSKDDWNEIAFRLWNGEWDGDVAFMLALGEWFAETGRVPSERSNAFFPIPEWGRTSGGNYINTIAGIESGTCPKCGSNLSETQVCTESPASTRKPNRYRCDEDEGGCGYRFEGITTG